MTHKLILAALLALLSSAPAVAQDASTAFDSRWNPYLGCWTVLKAQSGHSVPVAPGTMVCVRPSGRFGVAITTTIDGKSVLEQTILADGAPQPLSQGDCTGTQTSNWSRDGERLFTNVELTCAGRPKRVISGITLLANGQWVDSQATVVDRMADVRVRRYRRSSDGYTGPAGMTTAPLNIEDIIEASAKVQSEALEAALDEANARFELNSRVLIQLADNGVSRNVIDLMVAQAYPEKFEVERPSSSAASTSYGTVSGGGSTTYMSSSMYPYPMYDPFYSSYYYYSPFAYPYYWGPSYVYRYGSPFYPNYSYYNNYYGVPGGGYYPGGGVGSGDNIAPPGSPDSRGGDGVVVNGRGYTRVRPAGSGNTTTGETATPVSRTPGSTRGVRSAGSRDSGSSSSSGASSSSSSSSGSSSSSSGTSSSSGSSGASSGGYSSGGGGNSGGGGRTAQPR